MDGAAVPRPRGPSRTRTALPAPLTAAIALTAVLGIALSGAPQLVLRFADTGLFCTGSSGTLRAAVTRPRAASPGRPTRRPRAQGN